ncbi:MAG: TlpA family protein disulfide reductase, partial [Bdellovibrionota bacterium]
EGVSVYVISVDRTQAETQSFLDKTPLRMPFWWGGLNAKKTFQISILPTILILDEENRILSEYAGYSGERYFYLRKRLGSLLKTEDEEK